MLKETKSFGATSGISYHSARLLDLGRPKKRVHVEFHSHNPKAPGNKS